MIKIFIGILLFIMSSCFIAEYMFINSCTLEFTWESEDGEEKNDPLKEKKEDSKKLFLISYCITFPFNGRSGEHLSNDLRYLQGFANSPFTPPDI